MSVHTFYEGEWLDLDLIEVLNPPKQEKQNLKLVEQEELELIEVENVG